MIFLPSPCDPQSFKSLLEGLASQIAVPRGQRFGGEQSLATYSALRIGYVTLLFGVATTHSHRHEREGHVHVPRRPHLTDSDLGSAVVGDDEGEGLGRWCFVDLAEGCLESA